MVTDLLNQVQAAVEEMNQKKSILDSATAAMNTANKEYQDASAKVSDLRNQIHDSLGAVLGDSGRVRQSQ